MQLRLTLSLVIDADQEDVGRIKQQADAAFRRNWGEPLFQPEGKSTEAEELETALVELIIGSNDSWDHMPFTIESWEVAFPNRQSSHVRENL